MNFYPLYVLYPDEFIWTLVDLQARSLILIPCTSVEMRYTVQAIRGLVPWSKLNIIIDLLKMPQLGSNGREIQRQIFRDPL